MEFSITAAAAKDGRRIALIADGRALTYAEAAERTQRIIAWLRARGVGDRTRVGLVAVHRVETILALYALFELGATAVLIHPQLTGVERARLVEDSTPVLVLGDDWQPPADGPSEAPGSMVPCDDRPLAISYTSGSSGSPKGAILSRAALLASARGSAKNLGWNDDDRWLLAASTAHVGALSTVTRCLSARACMVLMQGTKFSAQAVAEAVERDRVTIVSLPPPVLDGILRREPRWDFPPYVRVVLMGSMAASPDLLVRARERKVPVLMTYGCTEACSQIATQTLGTLPGPDQGCGPPMHGTEVRIADGEIQVRGPTLLTDYFPPGKYPSPFTDDGWFRTGDLGRFDDRGSLHIVGRRTDRIVTGGENVDPLEVEHALTGVPGIAAAVVFGVPDDVWGQVVAAALVAVSEPIPDDVLSEHLARHLADFKRPRLVTFVAQLPTTPAGKIDRRGAPARLEASLHRLARKK